MTRSVFAYLDAGTGSLILQALIAGAAGVAAFVKFRWGAIRSRFKRAAEADE